MFHAIGAMFLAVAACGNASGPSDASAGDARPSTADAGPSPDGADAAPDAADPCVDHCHDDVTDCGEITVDCGGVDCRACRRPVLEAGIYPQGARFPLVLLALDTSDIAEATGAGWNVGHTYDDADTMPVPLSFVATCADGGMLTLGTLFAPHDTSPAPGPFASPRTEAEVAPVIADRAITGHVAWWDLPEEMRLEYPSEMSVVTSYSDWTRVHDPNLAPNLMYIPGHYQTADIQGYVPYLDIVAASCYPMYLQADPGAHPHPHAWVRWRMESTLQAIRDAGSVVGPRYLAPFREKTPVAYLELAGPTISPGITPEGTYHDFWQVIVSGARGILVYAHAYRHDTAALDLAWAQLLVAASRLTGPEDLEEAVLHGQADVAVSAVVATRTPAFSIEDRPDGEMLEYPAIDLLATRFDGELFVIAVNSAETSVSATIQGLPDGASADVLFEGRSAPVTSGRLVDTFSPLGVHVYRLRL